MKLSIIKCHGSGNDFIILDEMDDSGRFTEEQRRSLSILLSDRKGKIGSDGLLFVQNSEHCDARMRMFNSDGTEAEMCGNGLRCVARYAIEKLGKKQLLIETMKADLPVRQTEDLYPDMKTYEVAIEPVSLDPVSLPLKTGHAPHIDRPIPALSDDLSFTALSVPNPHVVTKVDDVPYRDAESIGRLANDMNDIFPNGVNVSFMKPLTKNQIFVQTYERGVGLTNACGTAMSASSLVSVLNAGNDLDEVITVFNPGGMVQTVVHQEGDVYTIKLRGNATYEYSSDLEVDLDREQIETIRINRYEDEKKLYAQVAEEAKRLVRNLS